jgi:hypothetical protein
MQPLEIARIVSDEMVEAGAIAVVLAGSYARGEASARSDLDLYAIGTGPGYQLHLHHGTLVSTSWRTLDEEQDAFRNPALAGAAVPGWRTAMILHDPHGVAAILKERAGCWTWDEIGDGCIDAWVAEELTGLAEEVYKLVSMLEAGNLQAAAVQRSVIALRVPMILATHLRILYDTENVLWTLVAERLGPEWARTQATALGVMNRPIQETCHAALMLFAEACHQVGSVFDERQRKVVNAAISVARDVSAGNQRKQHSRCAG